MTGCTNGTVNKSGGNKPAPRPRVGLYARYSSDLQRDASIEDQIRVCRVRADQQGWVVVDVFTDHAASGATTLRPGYQAMLAALRSGSVQIVLAESLDRFSRDLEHIAAFHKQCIFHQVRIHTVGEGDISELHIGLKGTMGALYLKDLAEKTRRGLEGRIHAGRCTGTPPYGYSVVRQLRGDGELDRGLRTIDPAKAAIVRRVFEAYAAGASPRRIALALNADGIPGPGGGIWFDSTILGRPMRGDGLLRNSLYVGRLVWRRRINVKDPTSGAKLRRNASPDAVVATDVPHLRIIESDLWERVQARLQQEAVPARSAGGNDEPAFWDRRRPRHLLTGKVECGCCGRLFKTTGKDYLGCRAAAHGTCRNKRTVRRVMIEAHVLEVLGRRFMQPDVVAEFIAMFNQECARIAREAHAENTARERGHATLDRRIANLVDAIGDGRSSPAILAKLAELESLKAKFTQAPSTGAAPTLALHPGIAQIYADRVANLSEALARADNPEALEAARVLIEKVIIHPPETEGDPPGIEVVGELAGLLKMAGVSGIGSAETNVADPVLDLFVSSVKAVPGAEPLALLLRHATNHPAHLDAVPVCQRLAGPLVQHVVGGQEVAQQGGGGGIGGAAGAVIGFDGEAQAQGGQGAGVDTFGAGFDEGGLAQGGHHLGVEPAGAGDHLRLGCHGVAQARGGLGKTLRHVRAGAEAGEAGGDRGQRDFEGGDGAAIRGAVSRVHPGAGHRGDRGDHVAHRWVVGLDVA